MSLDQLLGLSGADQSVAEWAGHGAAAPPGADCDAAIAPIVSGHVDPAELSRQIRDLLHDRANEDCAYRFEGSGDDSAVRLLAGPAGLAAYLRGQLRPQPAASISLPLDLGSSTETVTAHLRRGVTTRDKHCAFPGCYQPPAACEVHHLISRSRGGPTSLGDCCLLCVFHHKIAVHRWGWQLVLNPDGTTTAVSPDRSRTLHSHAPPTAA